MKVKLERVNDAVHFVARNEDGNTLHFDGAAIIGGEGLGVRPMQGFLMSLAACSSIDVVLLLKKMRQKVVDFSVDVQGERVETIPKAFRSIHLHYQLSGEIKPEKLEKVLTMAVHQLCSVTKMIENNVEVTYSYTITPVPHEV